MKTISDCRKYRICLGIFSLHFHICTLSKNRICTQNRCCRESATATGDLPRLSYQRKKAHGRTKQHKQMPQTYAASIYFSVQLQLCSRCETILCPFSDSGASLNPLLRKLRNKQLCEIEKKKKNFLQPFINEPRNHFWRCEALPNHPVIQQR